MSWKVETIVEVRREFVELCGIEGSNVSELCRRFGVSRKTGYKWLGRYRESGASGLADQSRRPLHSPAQTRPWASGCLGTRGLIANQEFETSLLSHCDPVAQSRVRATQRPA